MSDRFKGIISSVGLISLLMFGFQNCGEQPITDEILTDENGIVKIVDQWADQSLSFYEKTLEVDSSIDSVDVSGFCHRDNLGETLRWAVVEEASGQDIIDEGVVTCDRAGFLMNISSLEKYDCQSGYEVYIESPGGAEDMMRLYRNCK